MGELQLELSVSIAPAHPTTSLQLTSIHSCFTEPVLFRQSVERALGNPRKEKAVRFTTGLHFPATNVCYMFLHTNLILDIVLYLKTYKFVYLSYFVFKSI